MKRAIVLIRRTDFYPEPVVCGVFLYEDGAVNVAHDRIDVWKQDFLTRFPEFKGAEFNMEYTNVI